MDSAMIAAQPVLVVQREMALINAVQIPQHSIWPGTGRHQYLVANSKQM
jgi:hypothetical protein